MIYLIYLLVLWLFTVIITVYDKKAAKRKKGKKKRSRKIRVPERLFWLLAFLGAALPEYITMRLIHHKTRHKSFMWGLPAVAVLNFAVAILFIFIF